MAKAEIKRTFESESLVLPPLKMVLTKSEDMPSVQTSRKVPQKINRNFNEETVLRIIDRLKLTK